jgi:hypothetical protein
MGASSDPTAAGGGRGFCLCLRWRGRLRREIDHGFPLIVYWTKANLTHRG